MVRQLARRLLRGGAGAATVTMLGLVVATPGAAHAAGRGAAHPAGRGATHAAGPNAISISGPGLEKALMLRASAQPEAFAAVLSEVGWLSSGSGMTKSPDAGKLGDKYTLTVLTGDKPTQRYELYPLAAGGPRVFRPAKQPGKHRTTAAWFYGRLSLPDSLRSAGVPLAGSASSVTTGGIGGGETADKPFDPGADLTSVLAQWRRFVFLNGAVVVVIVLGLAGVSWLVRRRVDRLYRRAAEQGRATARRGR